MSDPNNTTTKLLTLLNVSAARPSKKPRLSDKWNEPSSSRIKAAASSARSAKASSSKRSKKVKVIEQVDFTEPEENQVGEKGQSDGSVERDDEALAAPGPDTDSDDKQQSAFNSHFAPDSDLLKLIGKPMIHSKRTSDYGQLQTSLVEGETMPDNIKDPLSYHLQEYKDFYHPSLPLNQRQSAFDKVAQHAINHVSLTRKKIVRNNERLSHTKDATAIETDTRDQGYTRPKVLLLSPQRSFAFKMLQSLKKISKNMSLQSENYSRAQREFSALSEDKLSSNPSVYADDHVEIHAGNTDDNFLLGIKLTRKSLKLYSDFYSSDIILASPLGLKLAYEKNSNCDYLSSIEVLVMDSLDVMTMQNWQLVLELLEPQSLSRLNSIPKESHDCDFSRVKPWYLDGQAQHFRQTIMFSSYDTTDISAVYHGLKNPAGRSRIIVKPEGVLKEVAQITSSASAPPVPQNFNKIPSSSFMDEPDRRFKHFTEVFFPSLMKSEVRKRRCLIVVPSTFDFIRVKNFMIRNQSIYQFSFTYISEETQTSDIARARHQFFKGSKEILLLSERFHFYRRYRIRGYSTLVFYQLPDHAHYYPEFVSFPYMEEKSKHSPRSESEDEDASKEVDVIPATLEGGVHALFSTWDILRLSAVVGSKNSTRMIKSQEKVFSFQ